MTPSKARKRPGRHPNPSRQRLRSELRRFARGTKRGMRVLDVGAGRGPYRHLFKHAEYESADFAQNETAGAVELNYVCDIAEIPVEDDRFDRIVCSQVLEHVPEPAAALRELHRILKPSGRIFLSAPLFHAEHLQPYDFFRYTQFGMRKLVEDAGFEVARLEWLEGYFGTVSYQYQQMRSQLPRDLDAVRALGIGRRRAVLAAPVLLANRWLADRLSAFYARLELATPERYQHGTPKNYLVVAVKKPEEPESAGDVG